jgi:hypothetical protein
VRRAKRTGGPLFGCLVVAHGDADDVVTGAQALLVAVHMTAA